MNSIQRSALEKWLAAQSASSHQIAVLRRIATGHSRAMWFVEMSSGQRFVVRIEQGGVFGSSGATEFEFMQTVARLGLPIAPARWIEPTGSVLGQPFFVMDYVEHLATPREERGLSDSLAADFVRQLHLMHTTDVSSALSGTADPADATDREIERWAGVYRSTAIPVPLLDEATAWLHHHAPVPTRVGIVHGDPGPGNFLHDGERLLVFTDWEFSHLGDPMEDWAFLIQMRGARTMVAEEWRALIKRTVDVEISDEQLDYWTAFNLFKGACANLTCRSAFVGANPSPNMAIIGTTIHQTFLRRLADLTAR
jgi:aminoglycoside phosphotransferase (APT) family kinase protein